LRERIEAVLDFARVRGLRGAENPARWKGHLDHLLPSPGKISRTRHHAALPYVGVPEFLTRLRAVSATAARALEFTILNAVRVGEACGARWTEIGGEVWTIPGERMKGGQEHRVPLSAASVAVLARMPREGDFVFPSDRPDRPVHGNTVWLLVKELGGGTVHGFRSAFRDWVREETNFPSEAAELALAHAIPSRTERAYRRGDMLEVRHEMMEAWGRHCSGEPASAVVVPIGARRHG
jgi:integrase